MKYTITAWSISFMINELQTFQEDNDGSLGIIVKLTEQNTRIPEAEPNLFQSNFTFTKCVCSNKF